MEIRRTIAAGTFGLVLVASGVGCGAAADKAAEKATERAVEEAIEGAQDCENVDIGEGGVSAECNGENVDIDAGGGAELPDAWPADLELPEGAKLTFASSNSGQISATGTIGGEIDAVTEAFRSALEAGGFTIGDESEAATEQLSSTSTQATSAEHEATVAVTDVESGTGGELSFSIVLQPVEG